MVVGSARLLDGRAALRLIQFGRETRLPAEADLLHGSVRSRDNERVAGSRLIPSMVMVMNYLDEDDDAITADDLKMAVERHAAAVVSRRPPRFLTTDERDNMLDLLSQLIAADPTFLPSLPPHAQQLAKDLLPHLRPGHGVH